MEHDCQNGALRQYSREIQTLCDEISWVMEREGQSVDSQSLQDQVFDVIETTAANTSSMLQDIRAQRLTEIEYITGFLLRRARTHGFVLTENTRLYDMIKRKESFYGRERLSTGLSGSWQ